MNINRVGTLLWKELRYGSTSFFFVFAILTPLVMSFAVTALFGSLFSESPKLGIVDEGTTPVVEELTDLAFIDSRAYESDAALREAVERGSVDVGIVFPTNFEVEVNSGQTVALNAYIWGESQANNRSVITAALSNTILSYADQQTSVSITAVDLGDQSVLGWQARLLPLIVMMAVVIGGTVVPAASVVTEKQNCTIKALVVSPTSMGEVLMAKAAMGAILSLLVGVMVLVINDAFGSQPVLLVFILALGAILAAAFGVLLSNFMKDMNTLFATVKGLGIVLYAPAFIYLFPDVPQWIAQVFPTYYIIEPITAISQEGAGFSDVLPEIAILVGIIVVVTIITGMLSTRMAHAEA